MWNFILLGILDACFQWQVISGCSGRYLNAGLFNDFENLGAETLLKYSNPPNTFQYLTGVPKTAEAEFVISYNYAKRSPVWAYEKLTSDMIDNDKDRSDELPEGSITYDEDIPEIFRPKLSNQYGDQYRTLSLIPYANHKNLFEKTSLHSNHVLVKMNEHERTLWKDLNQYIRNLAQKAGVKDLQVCTGTLYRSQEQKAIQEKERSENGQYTYKNENRTSEAKGQFLDQMKYEKVADFSVPDALYKAILFQLEGQSFLSMFVIPAEGRSSADGKSALGNHFWASLVELEVQAGHYIFEAELKRSLPKHQQLMDIRCKRTSRLLSAMTSVDVSTDNFYFTCNVKMDGAETSSKRNPHLQRCDDGTDDGNACIRFSDQKKFHARTEHTVQKFTNFIANYNHKNLVPDYVIEYIQSGWKAEGTGKSTFPPSDGMFDPFRPRDTTYDSLEGIDKKQQYNRGHMAPASFQRMSTSTYQETYTMMNIAPQYMVFNNDEWGGLEKSIMRHFKIKNYTAMYIMTGCIYGHVNEQQVVYNLISEYRIAAPTYLFKSVIFIDGAEKQFHHKTVQMENRLISDGEKKIVHDSLDEYPSTSRDEIEKRAGYRIFPQFHWGLMELLESSSSGESSGNSEL